jgi:polar amino acid transport system substrate-binding protein
MQATPISLRLSRSLFATAVIRLTIASSTLSAAPPANPLSHENQKPPLVVCAVPDAMPHTGKAKDGSPQGLDVAVAQLVAAELGRPLEVHWCASAACSWRCLSEKRCDMAIGQPHGSGSARDVAWSTPYSGSRFGLVVREGTTGIRSLVDLEGKRVGIVAGSVALASPVSSQGHKTIEFKTRDKLLDEFAASQLDAAFVDDDFAAWYLHAHPELKLARVAEYVPRERWNMGFAVRTADSTLLKEINRALTSVVLNGLVSKAFSEQGVSYRAPFTKSDAKPATGESWMRIRERGELVVSMDPANLPYSAAKGDHPGFDVELARLLAAELGVKLRIDWIDIHRKTAIGQLLDGECDLAFGAAIEPRAMDDEEEIGERVIYSRPYYGTGYFLVTRQNGPVAKSLADLKGDKSRRLGTEAGSVADYSLRQRGYLRRLFGTQLAVLKSLSDGGIDYAYLWSNVGWTLHASPELAVQLVADYVPEDHWNIAVAMRSGDDELKQHVDEGLQKLIDKDAVSRTLKSYHVPWLPVFTVDETPATDSDVKKGALKKGSGQLLEPVPDIQQPADRADADEAIRHGPTDRGREPQMERRQRSKQRYAALARIRSGGVLVVGLDHNSLPFSAAHPEPAGLDYDIARLLAEKLGVSLSVYWAYSSHDSYPSKLATKELCDVMLGVMPDDRFGKRVVFSKPYYFLDYRFVVPAGAAIPAENQPLAAERGLALRGLRNKQIHEYPSLESILEAVVEGKESAGYVTGARGQWLAETRWPGRLKFNPPADNAVDRFPICAAVRKSDADLRTAIDDALDELASSGKLTEVFARWHIPYDPPRKTGDSTGQIR